MGCVVATLFCQEFCCIWGFWLVFCGQGCASPSCSGSLVKRAMPALILGAPEPLPVVVVLQRARGSWDDTQGGRAVSVTPRREASAHSEVSVGGLQWCPWSSPSPLEPGCDSVILSDSFQLSLLLF